MVVLPSQARNHREMLPPKWPEDVEFIMIPKPSKGLSRPQKERYCSPMPPPNGAPSSSVRLKIRNIDSPTHPAYGGYGLFALSRLPRNSFLLDYLGQCHLDSESNSTSNYDLSLERSTDGLTSVSIDAQRCGNLARFINDYRGTQEGSANVDFRIRTATVNGQERVRMSVWSSKEILKGQELLLSYGKGFWSARTAAQHEICEAETI